MQESTAWRVAIFVVCVGTLGVFLAKLIAADGAPAEILAATVALVAVVIVVPRISDLATLRLPGGIEAQLRETKERVNETKHAIEKTNDRLDRLFANALGKWQISHLEKLESGEYGDYTLGAGLERDLRHLRDHGYITIRPTDSISSIPETGEDLSQYVVLTDTGEKFLALRRSLLLPKEDQSNTTPPGASAPDGTPRWARWLGFRTGLGR